MILPIDESDRGESREAVLQMSIRPLRRSITIVCVIFIILLSVVLSVTTYRIYTRTMYERYQKQMASILDYVESHIDKDDMAVCARTYEESEKYRVFQRFFDDLIDHYSDVHYLYIQQTLEPGTPLRTREICAANSTWEKENDPDQVMHLGDAGEGWFDPAIEDRFYEIQMGTEDVYLVNPSTWGIDYTLGRPLVSSAGDHFGVLCVDVAIDDLNAVVYRNIYINIAVIVVSGLAFIIALLLWMRSNVIKPIRSLQESVEAYADKSAGRHDPNELIFQAPNIRSRNEVRVLSDSVKKLSENMRDYLKGMVKAEIENEGLQTQAFQDALTKVKNKAAYDKKVEALKWDIVNSIAKFGLVMVDMNHLKFINDLYGHEHGNDYIVGSCKLICGVFVHSPVYRIGGDEFVVVLQESDYGERDRLLDRLKERFLSHMRNDEADPWHRYSAAIGMSVYRPGDSYEDVFSRADQAMYYDKTSMKSEESKAQHP